MIKGSTWALALMGVMGVMAVVIVAGMDSRARQAEECYSVTNKPTKKGVGWHPWPRPVTTEEFTQLLNVIATVESNQNINAVGDSGKAIGIYQIHKIYIDDLNRLYEARTPHSLHVRRKQHWEYEDRWDPDRSRWMVRTYLAYYARKELLGHEPTLEDMARIHNGGPDGWKKGGTKKYWEKVKKHLAFY